MAAKQAMQERVFLFSSESVNEGHADKVFDQVSDAALDACLAVDPKCKVACDYEAQNGKIIAIDRQVAFRA